MFMVMYGNIVDGVTFVGPFTNHDAALAYCEGDDSQWNVVEIENPPQGTKGLADELTEIADDIGEVISVLEQPLIGPSEQTEELVRNLKLSQLSLQLL